MSSNDSFDSVMLKITQGLTGNPETDFEYLGKTCQKYNDHPMAKEIARACGRLMYDMLPDDKKDEMNRAFANDSLGINETLEEIRFNIFKKNYDKALDMAEQLVTKLEKANMFEDDSVSEYRDFGEYFEQVLYRFIYKPEKTLRRSSIPYAEIYLLYGSLLVEFNKLAQARAALKKGLKWNPINFQIMSEYMETFKMEGDLNMFFDLTIDAFRIAYRPESIARCYRNLGYYFIEKKKYSEATAVYILSTTFDKQSQQAQSELYYISKVAGDIPEPKPADIEKYSKKYGFPFGAHKDIIGLSNAYGEHFKKKGDTESARYFYEILYGVTHNDKIKEILDDLKAN